MRCVAAAALAGCGTTVPLAQQQSTSRLSDGGSPVVGDPTSSDEVVQGAAPGAVVESTGPSAALPLGSAAGTSSEQTTTVTVPSGPAGTARKNAPVEVGIAYAENAAAFGEALGGSLDLGDGKAQNDALIAYVNAHGGLAGHPIKPVYYAVDLTRTVPWSVFVQEACSLWTEDHKVIAASFPVNIDVSQLSSCLKKRGAVLDASSLRIRSQSDYTASPLLVEPWMITAERLAPLYVRGLQQQGYFAGKPVVGLLTYDYPQSRLLGQLIKAELRKIGSR